jgi:type I restriction enzyme, S subunit
MIAEQLKRSILQAAIQGKLTEQLPEDGDAHDLLKEIQKEKARLIREGKIKKGKPLVEVADDEPPFDIPKNWCWVRLETLSKPCDYPFADGPFGSNLKREHYTEEHEVRIIQLSNIGENSWRNENTKYTTYDHLKSIARSEVKAGDIVIAKMMPAGRAIRVPYFEQKYVLSSDAIKFVPNEMISKSFVLYAINSDCFRNQIAEGVHGITRIRTSLSKVKTYLIPLPPLDEQKRIVQCLEGLFLEIDKLNTDESKLDALQKAFPKKMKNAILQYAVQGKLTEQLKSDGDARELLEEIRKEKAPLIEEGKIDKEKPLPEITEDELPFDIPENWCWVRFGDIKFSANVGLDRNKEEQSIRNQYEYFKMNNIGLLGECYLTDMTRVNASNEEVNRCQLIDGDFLFNTRNSRELVGKTCVVEGINGKTVLFNNNILRVKLSGGIEPQYINYWFCSKSGFEIKQKYVTSTTNVAAIYQRQLNEFLVPLPPVLEQKRVVTEVKNVIPICDKLVIDKRE